LTNDKRTENSLRSPATVVSSGSSVLASIKMHEFDSWKRVLDCCGWRPLNGYDDISGLELGLQQRFFSPLRSHSLALNPEQLNTGLWICPSASLCSYCAPVRSALTSFTILVQLEAALELMVWLKNRQLASCIAYSPIGDV